VVFGATAHRRRRPVPLPLHDALPISQKPDDLISQAATLLADLPVKAIKIGLIGHHDTAAAIQTVLTGHPQIPVVLDPVLAAGGSSEEHTSELQSRENLVCRLLLGETE